MIVRPNLDMDALRSFVAGIDAGSFARAADRVGRSPAAVSQHLRKLERQFGARLFDKQGRGLVLTAAGETALAYARRLLVLNDEAVAATGAMPLAGRARLGLVQDFAEGILPGVLAAFARTHPEVVLEARVGAGRELVDAVGAATLDAALVWGEPAVADREWLGVAAMQWMGDGGREPAAAQPIPLVLLEAPCRFREAACAALDAAGIPWRVAFASPSLGAAWAAVSAGLGVMPRLCLGAPPGVEPLPGLFRVAPLPMIGAWLAGTGDGGGGAQVAALREEVAGRVAAVLDVSSA